MSNSNPDNVKIVHLDDAAPEDKRFVLDSLINYNANFIPVSNYEELNLFVRDETNNNIMGGLLGTTDWEWLYISILWVSEHLRGQGVGSNLLHQAETIAKHRGCKSVHLDTFDFQALPFYEKHGFSIFGVLENYPTGHTRYYLKKHF